MAWQFLHPELGDDVAVGATVAIEGPEAHHAAVVSRVRVGERVRIADGAGRAVSGPVTAAARDRVAIAVESVEVEPPPRVELWLVQALAKGDRGELAIQAATELGATGVVPWQAARSVSRWSGDKVRKGVARWESVVREAAKQALRARIPQVGQPADLAQLESLASSGGTDAVTVVLDPEAPDALTDLCADGRSLRGAARISIVVGPEGGLDQRELDRLEAAGAVRARLGGTVLRTSTAGPAAIAVLQALVGDWSAGSQTDSFVSGP